MTKNLLGCQWTKVEYRLKKEETDLWSMVLSFFAVRQGETSHPLTLLCTVLMASFLSQERQI